jgi:DNA-binding transcriptional LysR family regulator
VKVSVIELDRTEIEQQLINGRIDVAILLASEIPDPKRIETRIMFSSRRRLWLAPSHELMSASEIHLADLTKEPYLLLTSDDNEETTSCNWRRHGLRPNVEFRTVSIEAVRSLVATGAGVTILSDLVYRPWSLEGDRIEARLCRAVSRFQFVES